MAEHAKRFAEGCGLDPELYYQAGLWHDLGKLDPRFQAMLKQSSPRTAVGTPLAKSARSPRTKQERDEAREVHRYPAGARHELLSAALVATKTDDDLLLHLIATHHGSGRPFADPVVENDAAKEPFKTPDLFGQTFELPTAAQQIAAWNAELPERFWRVVRKFGWWGAAYRETIFRLADHAQSREEQDSEKELKATDVKPPPFTRPAVRQPTHPVPLTGLDGANPLAFLAALGTLVVFDRIVAILKSSSLVGGSRVALVGHCRFGLHAGFASMPRHRRHPAVFADFLAEHLARSPDDHPAKWVVDMLADENRGADEANPRSAAVRSSSDRAYLDWVTALACESVPEGASQLQTVRRDYLLGNMRSIMQRTTSEHLRRSLFHVRGTMPMRWTINRCTGSRVKTAAMRTNGTCLPATRHAKSGVACSGPIGWRLRHGRSSRRSPPATGWRLVASKATVPATLFGRGRCGVNR